LLINQPDGIYYGKEGYIKGIINLEKDKAEKVKLFCDNEQVKVYDNEFEVIVKRTDGSHDNFTSLLKAVLPSGKTITKRISFNKSIPAFEQYSPMPKGVKEKGQFVKGKDFYLSLACGKDGVDINIPGTALPSARTISITALRDIDIPAMNSDLINVTGKSKGYRFLPHGSNFATETKLSIPYDSTLIPEGYTTADIRTYYFDEVYRQWRPLPVDTIMTKESLVVAKTTHFTDIINGIIKVPESPQTQGYTPTSIKDLKAADPSAGITLINPPMAGSTGSASLSFNLKVPAGAQSLQPDLTFQYNNQGGNSWTGLGWSLTIPSVGIETRWGAPRYDPMLETETYIMNGQSLAPLVQRETLKPRSANKTFTARVEGVFNRIIRHGDHPSNYWWEVTSKDGRSNYYGGSPSAGVNNNAVLTDNNGNIGYWALMETRDANDNYIQYQYEMISDAGIAGGTVAGKQLYIRHIYYTGHGNTTGPYTIEFLRDRQLGEPKRKDIDISGILGFKMVSTDLLRKVNITVQNQAVRSYELTYRQGKFSKTLLNSISELDVLGNLFYGHQFDYYDDVSIQGNFKPLGNDEPWHPGSDNIKGDLLNPIPGFTAEGSALSTSKSSTINGGLTLTAGSAFGGLWSKLLSIGGNFSYSEDKSEGLVSMLDINGDGRPDKVFKKDNKLYYRAGLGVPSAPFAEARLISGIGDFSISKSRSTTTGFQVIPLIAFYGNSNTNSTSTTSVYFSDFNGDGLIDIVSNGKVYFNHINADGDPEFEEESTSTPSPVLPGGTVDMNFLTKDTALQTQQEDQFPLQDIIRVWQAPFSGVIKVTAPVRLLNIPDPSGLVNKKKDGVRISIQVGSSEKWLDYIPPSDYTIRNPTGVNNLSVTKGQKIYFRVESVYNGEDDIVEWSPEIEYLTPVLPAIDANNRPSGKYSALADYILDNKSATRMGKDGKIGIDGIFSKGMTSDTVTLLIVRERKGVDSIIYSEIFPPGIVLTKPIDTALNVITGDNLRFRLLTDTYIDRCMLKWAPHFQYTSFTDNTPLFNNLGQPTMEGFVVSENTNYNDWRNLSLVMNTIKRDTIRILPAIQFSGKDSGRISFTIKSMTEVIARQSFKIKIGQLTVPFDTVLLDRIPNKPFYIDYTIDRPQLANTASFVNVLTFKDSTREDNNQNIVPIVLRDTLNTGLYTNHQQEQFGSLFRGWGQFSFRGAKNHFALDESKLNQDEFTSYPTDPSKYEDPSLFGSLKDPSKVNFITLYANAVKKTWVGYDSAVFVSNTLMSASRLWMHDVSVDSFMLGASVSAVSKISTTKTKSSSLGISFIGISATEGKTNAVTTTNLDMMDMNGDRYPDVVNENVIQYTLPTGGLQAGMKNHNAGPMVSEGNSRGFSLGGGFPVAHTTKSTPGTAMAEQREASVSIGISGNTGHGDNDINSSWNDINGDGLPDKLYMDGQVALNFGYSFAPKENWMLGGIEKNIDSSWGAGLGVTLDAGSFQAGFGLSRGKGRTILAFQDINGDGLPDKLALNGNHVSASINTGNGFDLSEVWHGQAAINSNVSTGESINGAFTFCFTLFIIPIKICINPAVSTGRGVSRRQYQVMDINGDGFPDILKSENDGDLSASLSLIGRTNMLKKVTRPLGGSFTIDYERLGNSYEMPQSKWVLKSVEIIDGIRGDGIDTMRSVFRYEGGIYNRHEREFYGFSKTVTEQLNGDIVYRRQVKTFLNNSYYEKGLVKNEWTEDAAGHKFIQTNSLYDLRPIQANSYYPTVVQTEKLFYEGQPTAGASSVMQFDYNAIGNMITIKDGGDGTAQDMISAEITYHNLNNLYIKSVPSGIIVTTAEGIKRKRTTLIDNTGNITRIQQFLADGTSAVTDMQYDSYGNLSKITRPANYKNERMWYAYEYDNVAHNYVTQVTDAFGYKSTNAYDFRFGTVTKTVSMSEEPIQYTFDDCGRLATITGPYEIGAGKLYTIAQEYYPDAAVPYAITRHYDPEHNDDIRTITFMDGLARPVQVKKQTSFFKGKNIDDEVGMIVSGKIEYDGFGRAVKTYYPITETIGANNANYSALFGTLASSTSYDVQDRQLVNVLGDGSTTVMEYTLKNSLFHTKTIDALNNAKESLADVRGRNRVANVYGGPDGTITTTFFYNALSELLKVADTKQNSTSYSYDNLGRKLGVLHPDAGLTTFSYDLAGNLLEKTTAQLRKEIPNGGAIKYGYEYERLIDIDYPRYYQNKVKYMYGAAGSGSRTGRMMLVMDASGGEEYFYGKLGEITKTIRTVLISPVYAVTYVSEQEYDTWNRIKTMTYPDGEKLTYHYNRGGSLKSFEGEKLGNKYKYIDQLGYDEYDQRVYLRYGNGTETEYTYDPVRRRLENLQALTAAGRQMMNNTYSYDAVSNILGIENNVQTDSAKLGGYAKYDYDYDNLYRLVNAKGVYRGRIMPLGYSLEMKYDNLYNIVNKKMIDSLPRNSYEYAYKYEGTAPHQATHIGSLKQSYDANGNLLGNLFAENYWDEENRLTGVLSNGTLSRYTYNASGERVIKSSGGIQGIWVNGAPAGTIKHYDNYTAYVSPYLVCRKDAFTKHYYIESQRVTSKIGHGRFTNTSFPIPALTAGGVDYTGRASQIEQNMTNYYASLGLSPGPPTDKNFWGRPENNGIAPPVYVDASASNVPPGWPSNPHPTPWHGQPIVLSNVPSRDSVYAGFGFDGTGHNYEKDQYFYHSDHLGSTSYVTDLLGEVNQHVEYSAFGETFFEEHTSSFTSPYLFNAKEKDVETGLYYYGARYYNPKTSVWLSVDPMAEKYPGISAYNYTFNNPIKFVDPDGRAVFVSGQELTKQAKATLNNDNFKPSRDGDKLTTHCNEGLINILNSQNDHSLDGMNANEIGKKLRDNPSFATKISSEEALNYANQGVTVIASYVAEKGSGHVAVISPGEKLGESKNWQKVKGFEKGTPTLFNVGTLYKDEKDNDVSTHGVKGFSESINAKKSESTGLYILNSDLKTLKERQDKVVENQ
jgi:RHS repeat-associated protein